MITHRFFTTGGANKLTTTDASAVINPRMSGETRGVRTGLFHAQNTTASTVKLYGSMDNATDSYVLLHTTASLASNGTDADAAVVTLYPYMYAQAGTGSASLVVYLGE
jgi:hypothetical protein